VILFTLCVEPLGNLLRAHPEHGVQLSPATTLTGAFFADDSLLFIRDLTALDAQLQLVGVYCRGSGAQLNRTKSQLLKLNRNRDPVHVPGLGTVLASIKYLGISIGPVVTVDAVARELESKLTAALNRWKYRARTMLGRLLLANSVVLPILWHFTPHYDFPKPTIELWQRMINNYVLYGTPPDAARSLHLISKALHAVLKADGGVQIP
jgi:hypothetical protein